MDVISMFSPRKIIINVYTQIFATFNSLYCFTIYFYLKIRYKRIMPITEYAVTRFIYAQT